MEAAEQEQPNPC